MKWLNSIAKAANNLLMVFAALIAAVLLVTGLYVLNDIYYTNAAAFVSYDLLKYRPVSKSSDDETIEYTFENLKQINSDTVGWIEMFGTNINYPVMQGSNNLEYLNKDIFGYHTFTGSIYLAAENDSEMGDWYDIIYGHHMENGAMFGDIEKYLDSDYFASHNEGILQTEKGDYHISVFACIRTNAYEDTVYQVKENAEEKYPALKDYIREHIRFKYGRHRFDRCWSKLRKHAIKQIRYHQYLCWAVNPAIVSKCREVPYWLYDTFKEYMNPHLAAKTVAKLNRKVKELYQDDLESDVFDE